MAFLLLPILFLCANAQNNSTGFLPEGSSDNMETREKVRTILSQIQVPTPTPRKISFARSGAFGIKKPSHPPPGQSIVELNQNVSRWMFEGDMLLTVAQAQKIAANRLTNKKRAATTDPNNYWSMNTPIYYFMDQSIINDKRKYPLVQQAVKYWQTNTCLNFVNNPNGKNALRYYIGDGCWSYVGKQPAWKTQDISIGNGCESLGTVCHETAHALGFYHQQSRSDRDQYVYVDFSNIAQNLQSNFVKLTPKDETNFGIPFDYSSVMQYDAYAFALNPRIPTMTPTKANFENAMGQREAPAFSDVMMVNYLYNCSTRCSSKPVCQNSGIVNSRACNQCLCPRQFSGPTCTGLMKGSAMSCNGQQLQATSSWQILNATAGDPNSYDPTVPVTDCYWHIQAPYGYRISLYITGTTQCSDGCNFQAFEVNLGNFALGGMVMCCDTSMLTSIGNLVTIRARTSYNQAKFVIHYKLY